MGEETMLENDDPFETAPQATVVSPPSAAVALAFTPVVAYRQPFAIPAAVVAGNKHKKNLVVNGVPDALQVYSQSLVSGKTAAEVSEVVADKTGTKSGLTAAYTANSAKRIKLDQERFESNYTDSLALKKQEVIQGTKRL